MAAHVEAGSRGTDRSRAKRRATALALVPLWAIGGVSCSDEAATPAVVVPSAAPAAVVAGETPEAEPEAPGRPKGLWKRVPVRSADPDLDAEERERVRRLESLGYVAGSVAAVGNGGVTVHRADRVDAGLNFLTSGHAPEALLVDMQGAVLHRWHASFESLFPDSPLRPPSYWRRAALLPGGDVIAIFEGKGIARLDRGSEVVWTNDVRAHHDLQVLPNGETYVLTRDVNRVAGVLGGRPFSEDFISVLDARGRVTRQVSVLEALLESPYSDLIDPDKSVFGDVFHTNSLQVLDGKIAGRAPAFAARRVLVSLGVQNLIAVIDLDEGRAVWAHRADFVFQHHPRVLENGNLLLFDNGGARRGSRVLEIDPVTLAQRWHYAGTPEAHFFSATCGAAQRLPNGNTLITESDSGRAFEILSDGTIVWEFRNPYRAGPERELVAALLEVVRLPERPEWLDAVPGAAD